MNFNVFLLVVGQNLKQNKKTIGFLEITETSTGLQLVILYDCSLTGSDN